MKDADEDGKLSITERRGMRIDISPADYNGDGDVTVDECALYLHLKGAF